MKTPSFPHTVAGVCILLLLGCNVPSATPPAAVAGPAETAKTPVPDVPITDATIAVTGPIETVYDWSVDRCAREDRPDMALRPFRDADGNVQANRSFTTNRRFAGPDLDSIQPLCDVILQSDFDPDDSHYNNSEWMQAYYTEDGRTVHAILHNEHNERGTSYWTMTYALSTDGGLTFQQPDAPEHFVAGSPHPFQPNAGLYGHLAGSNIVKGPDGAYYMLVTNRTLDQQSYTCLFRSQDLADPAAWRAWDGEGFDWTPVNPYLSQGATKTECAPIDSQFLGGIGIGESLIYSEYLGKYVTLGAGHFGSGNNVRWGIVYATSDDMIHWENKKLLMEILNSSLSLSGGPDTLAYIVLLDPDSGSRNFETADQDAYVYFAQFNYSSGMEWPDTDERRFPIKFFPNAEQAAGADVRTKLSLRRDPDPERVAFTGALTASDGSPLAGRTIELVAMPDDEVGLVQEYTYSGVVPPGAEKGTAGIRVNTECNCSGRSELFIYEMSYTENGGPNLIQGPRFQNGTQNLFSWGIGKIETVASDQGEGRMLHVQAEPGQDISFNSWEFSVTPGAAYTYTVKARVVPGSFGTGFFGLFTMPYEDYLRVTIPFFNPQIPIGQGVTDENGEFTIAWPEAAARKYEVRAAYPGSGEDWGAEVTIKSIVK